MQCYKKTQVQKTSGENLTRSDLHKVVDQAVRGAWAREFKAHEERVLQASIEAASHNSTQANSGRWGQTVFPGSTNTRASTFPWQQTGGGGVRFATENPANYRLGVENCFNLPQYNNQAQQAQTVVPNNDHFGPFYSRLGTENTVNNQNNPVNLNTHVTKTFENPNVRQQRDDFVPNVRHSVNNSLNSFMTLEAKKVLPTFDNADSCHPVEFITKLERVIQTYDVPGV